MWGGSLPSLLKKKNLADPIRRTVGMSVDPRQRASVHPSLPLSV